MNGGLAPFTGLMELLILGLHGPHIREGRELSIDTKELEDAYRRRLKSTGGAVPVSVTIPVDDLAWIDAYVEISPAIKSRSQLIRALVSEFRKGLADEDGKA